MKSKTHASFSKALGMSALALAIFAGTAVAQPVIFNANPQNAIIPEPIQHKSYVRDAAGKIVLVDRDDLNRADRDYSLSLQQSGWGAVDTVMTQCFAGGFRNDMIGRLQGQKSYTFASASQWNQVAYTVQDLDANPQVFDNFTRAYRESAYRYPLGGMDTNYMIASAGAAAGPGGNPPAINGDPSSSLVAPVGVASSNSAYAATSANAGLRRLNQAANGLGQRFAVLVLWDQADLRHQANLQRMYRTLVNSGVPTSRITILTPNAMNPADPVTSQQLPIEDPNDPLFIPSILGTRVHGNTRQDWADAIAGKHFFTGPGPNDYYTPTANDSLFIYNTGHGGHSNLINEGVIGDWDNDGQQDDVRYIIPDANNFVRGNNQQNGMMEPRQGQSIGTPGGPGGPARVNVAEVLFKVANINGISASIDGVDLGLLTNAANGFSDNDPIITNLTFQKLFSGLDNSARVAIEPNATVIDFKNCTGAQLSPLLMAGALFSSADQQFLGVVPAPASAVVLLGLGGFTLRRRR